MPAVQVPGGAARAGLGVRDVAKRGIADWSACVYGRRGVSNTSSTGPDSTIRPRYITATRSEMYRTTDRSCAMKT